MSVYAYALFFFISAQAQTSRQCPEFRRPEAAVGLSVADARRSSAQISQVFRNGLVKLDYFFTSVVTDYSTVLFPLKCRDGFFAGEDAYVADEKGVPQWIGTIDIFFDDGSADVTRQSGKIRHHELVWTKQMVRQVRCEETRGVCRGTRGIYRHVPGTVETVFENGYVLFNPDRFYRSRRVIPLASFSAEKY